MATTVAGGGGEGSIIFSQPGQKDGASHSIEMTRLARERTVFQFFLIFFFFV